MSEDNVKLNNITDYDRAMNWLDKHLEDANKRGDHDEQYIVKYIEEMLWRYEDMRNS